MTTTRQSSLAFTDWVLREGGAEFELLARHIQYHLAFSRFLGRGGVRRWSPSRWRAFLGRHGGTDCGRLVLMIDLAARRWRPEVAAAECAGLVDDVNDPYAFNALPVAVRLRLLCYCLARFEPARRADRRGSYQLKHECERLTGLYSTNGQFAGALLCAGFTPIDAPGPTLQFRVRRRRLPC
jgi:hypothetical protein